MRVDEEGNPCPSTLAEYRLFCLAIGGDCEAVAFLDDLIAGHDPDEELMIPDLEVRILLMPLLRVPRLPRDGMGRPILAAPSTSIN